MWQLDPDFEIEELSAASVASWLGARSPVRSGELWASCPSTNDRALALLDREDVPWPALVWSLQQTAGRGRSGQAWWSSPGSLLFSYAVNLEAFGWPTALSPRAALLAGLAVSQTLEACSPRLSPGVKWPNDVLIGRRKICGILTESLASRPGRLVIGIGLNVNTVFDTAPPEIVARSTSLRHETSQLHSVPEVLAALLDRLDLLLREFRPGRQSLSEAWQRGCVLQNRLVKLRVGHREVIGRCRGIDEDGALLVDLEHGQERFISGSVQSWCSLEESNTLHE